MPAATAELRPVADDRHEGGGVPADPSPPRRGRPRVAITLGTVNAGQVDVLRALVQGAARADADVVVALGAEPASLGPVPPHVSVHAYVPMSTLLPAADVVVFHGGSGTMLAALVAGTPMVIVPLAADQPDNAERCLAAGVARVVALEDVDASRVEEAVGAVATDHGVRARARAVADEVARMPGPAEAVERLEAVAAAG